MPRPFNPQDVLLMPLMANLATQGDHGPCIAPVWFIWEDRALWMLGSADSRSVARLLVRPACAVEIVHFDHAEGILLHLGFRGRASLESMDAARFRRLLARYLGPDETAWNSWFVETVAAIDDPNGRWIRLMPDSTFTNNVSYFRTGPALAWPR